MLDNPYRAADVTSGPVVGRADLQRIKARVRPPAILLAALSSVAMLIDIIILTEAILVDPPKILRQEGLNKGPSTIISNIAANVSMFLIHSFILYGSVKMIMLKSYTKAMISSLFSLIPFCSPIVLLGLPFGIWALIVLRKRDVIEAFRRV